MAQARTPTSCGKSSKCWQRVLRRGHHRPPHDKLDFRPFPMDAIPEPVRRFVTTCAKSIGCDRSYVAVPFLVAAAAPGLPGAVSLPGPSGVPAPENGAWGQGDVRGMAAAIETWLALRSLSVSMDEDDVREIVALFDQFAQHLRTLDFLQAAELM